MKHEISDRLLWLCVILMFVAALSGCQRTDYYLQDDLLYISNTSWCTDSSSQKIVIDPNGLVTVTGYGKQEDSIKASAIVGGVPVTVETKGERK